MDVREGVITRIQQRQDGCDGCDGCDARNVCKICHAVQVPVLP